MWMVVPWHHVSTMGWSSATYGILLSYKGFWFIQNNQMCKGPLGKDYINGSWVDHQKQKVYPENNLYIAPTAERPTTNPGCSKIIGRPTPIKTTYPGKQYMQCRMLQNEYIQHLFFLYLMFYSKKTLEISQESKAIHALIFHLGITSLVRHVEKSRRCVRFNKVMAPLKSLVRIFPWLPGERSIQYTPWVCFFGQNANG